MSGWLLDAIPTWSHGGTVRRTWAVIAALPLVLAVGCRAPDSPIETIRGRVVDVSPNGTYGQKYLLNELQPSVTNGYAYVRVPPGTPIYLRRSNGALQRGQAGDIAVGVVITATHTVVELRSLPPQYTATRVVRD